MKTALLVMALLALSSTSQGFLKDTLDSAKNRFVDLFNELAAFGSALLDATLSQAKSLLTQSVQALGGAIISTWPPKLAAAVFGKSSEIFAGSLDELTARGETLKVILNSTLADLEQLNKHLYENLHIWTPEDFNTYVEQVTDRHKSAVGGVFVDVTTEFSRAIIDNLRVTVSDQAKKLPGDQVIGKRNFDLLKAIDMVNKIAEPLFTSAEASILQLGMEVGEFMKDHATQLLKAIREKTDDAKGEIISVEDRMKAQSEVAIAQAKVMLEQLMAGHEALIRLTVSKLQEIGRKTTV